jgi:hypothetical protein
MPGKSRRKKAKYPAKGQRRGPAASGQKVAVPQVEQTAASTMPASLAKEPAPVAKPAVVIQHPHIAVELRTIGILGGIMLVILIVLAFVLG